MNKLLRATTIIALSFGMPGPTQARQILKEDGIANVVLASDACAWDDAKAKSDADALGKLLVDGDSNFIVILNKHYGPKGDRSCAAPVFLTELAAYEQQKIGRSDVRLLPQYEKPEAGHFNSPYPDRDGTIKGYSIDYTNLQAQNAVYMLGHGSNPTEVNNFLIDGDPINDKDTELFKKEFDRRKGSLPYDVVIVGTDVEIKEHTGF
jgi:hypothetical protein